MNNKKFRLSATQVRSKHSSQRNTCTLTYIYKKFTGTDLLSRLGQISRSDFLIKIVEYFEWNWVNG